MLYLIKTRKGEVSISVSTVTFSRLHCIVLLFSRSRHHAQSVSWLRRTEYISTEQTRFQPTNIDKVEAKVGFSIKKNFKVSKKCAVNGCLAQRWYQRSQHYRTKFCTWTDKDKSMRSRGRSTKRKNPSSSTTIKANRTFRLWKFCRCFLISRYAHDRGLFVYVETKNFLNCRLLAVVEVSLRASYFRFWSCSHRQTYSRTNRRNVSGYDTVRTSAFDSHFSVHIL